MSKLMMVSLSSLLVACVSSGAPKTSTQPVAYDRSLPSVDRLGKRIDLLGADPKINLRLCTDRDGRVASVNIENSSELGTFDQAVLHDVANWQFEPTTAPECRKLTVRYNPQV
jgi:TonB family protein